MTERRDDDAQIDAALRRLFEPPPVDAMVERVAARRPAARHRVWPWVALAAAALIAFLAWPESPQSAERVADARLVGLWVDTYRDAVAAGFDAGDCCDGSSDLRAQCEARFAAALEIAGGADLRVCGAYCGRPAGGAIAMLVRSGGAPVCLFVLPRDRAPQLERTRHGDVSIHRREIGQLVAFEVCPADEPRVLPSLYEP